MTSSRSAIDDAARPNGESGFTIVEAIVGFVIVVILILGVATTFQLSFRNELDLRVRQQATAMGLESIEFARSLPWEELALASEPDATIPHHSAGKIDGGYFGLEANELLVVGEAGLVDPGFDAAATLNDQQFSVYEYVTEVRPGLRRVVVLVTWDSPRGVKEYQTSTLIAQVGTS